MKKLGMKLLKGVVNLTMVIAALSVNVTCGGRYYQEKMDGELEALRKYKDE